MKPILLDLFCKAGGCTRGYQQAGFYAVGVDITIYKIVNGQQCGVNWSIAQVELAQAHKESLLSVADHYMEMIDTAIAKVSE